MEITMYPAEAAPDMPPVETWSLARPSARRSLLLCGAGALFGLAVAGVGLFTAKGTRTSQVPAEDVALVNQVPILMSDYAMQVRALYNVSLAQANATQRRQVLSDMIREELYVQRGGELGLQTDTVEVRQALVGAVEAQAAADATMAQPDEAQLRAYYLEHRLHYADEGVMDLTDYVLPADAGPRAPAIAAALRAQKGSSAVAAQLGVHPADHMKDGEEFYFAARIHLGDRLFAVARALPAGQVSQPVQLSDGLHLLVMHGNSAPQPRRFEEVRDRVLTDFTADQARLLTAGNERFLRKRADIEIQQGYQ